MIELGQTISDQIAQDIGLQPITVEKHNFGGNSNTYMSWHTERRVVKVNINRLSVSPHIFFRSLGHEILGHAVQDALIAGEDIEVSAPDEVVEVWRENMLNYFRSPLSHEYHVNRPMANLKYRHYRNQPVEVYAVEAGNEFRKQTRQIVLRLPDDVEFIILFIVLMCVFGILLVTLDSDDVSEMQFDLDACGDCGGDDCCACRAYLPDEYCKDCGLCPYRCTCDEGKNE
jgi:hypothetical protein